MKKIVKLLLLLLLVMFMIWPIYYFINKKNSGLINYSMDKPFKRDIQNFIICSGIISPKDEVEIKSRVSGILEKIYVKLGDSVFENQIIAKIKIIPDIGQLSNAESKLKLAKINFENQKKQYTRSSFLFKKGIISKSDFEEEENAFLNSQEKLNNSQKEFRIIKSGDNSSNKHSNTSIISTIDGIIIGLPTKIGSTIIQSNNFNDGTTVAKIADMSEMIFEGNVKEYEVADLQVGMKVSIKSAMGNFKEEGLLSEISKSGKNVDGMIMFNIKSKLKTSKLDKTGFSANAKILTKERKNVLCIKEEWLSFKNDSSYIYIHKTKSEFDKKHINIGLSDGVYSEVLSGLSGDETIRVYDR